MKRMGIAAVILAAATALAGCGGTSSAPAGGGGQPVTIEYYHVNSDSFGGPTVRELVQKFNQTHKDVQVVDRFQPDMYAGLMQNLQSAIAAGKPPAVSQISYSHLDYAAGNFPHVAIADLFKNDPTFLSDFPSNILDLGKVKGKVEGIPYSISNPVIYYNADLFKKAGLDPANPPKTWDEVRTMGKTVKDKTGAWAVFIRNEDNWSTQALIESNGGHIVNPDGTLGLTDPPAVQAIQMWGDMVNKDKIMPNVTYQEAQQAFLSGKLAMYIATVAELASLKKQATFDLRTALYPTFGDKPRKVPAGGNVLMVFAKDPAQQKAAMEFIQFLESPDNLKTWSLGTGYLPSRLAAGGQDVTQALLQAQPLMKPAVEQLKEAVPWKNIPGPNSLQGEKILLDARMSVLAGKNDAQSALQSAKDRITPLLPKP
ncbi:ABC transporter substrate-binding protein [Kyrpidia sp.]|uniref:ABC transporter substrate-binding protein n=1 Tax=Kyrpidia sp. TaxID=2073077 RepID=UPI00258797BF|nr:ABC transporter substrate-binding protein [Kyrpidia sp.]MCL6575152.1 ABC transporter substrate-binding protein [Kyrpidia sp.]